MSEFKLAIPARAENVLVVRQAIAGLGEALGLSAGRVADLKTVVTEAANNVVLHAYRGEPGPLEVSAAPKGDEVEIEIRDYGKGFEPRPSESGEASLGLGLPLIASLSDSFQIAGGAGEGTRTTVRFAYAEPERSDEGESPPDRVTQELEMEISPGEMVRPVLARVIRALAARAELSVDRLSDTVLLGDAFSAGTEDDFSTGQLGIALRDGDGTLDMRVGPLAEGAGDRILGEMEIPGAGSLRTLAQKMEVTREVTDEGEQAEYLVVQVAS